MALTLDQLAGRSDREFFRPNAECRFDIRSAIGAIEGCRVDRGPNDDDLLILDADIAQRRCHGFRDRDDPGERPVAHSRENPHFRVVDAPRHDRRHVGKTGRQPAEHIGAAAAVTNP